MNFDATKKIKHCYTRTNASKKKNLKKKMVVTQEPIIEEKKMCCNQMYYTLPKENIIKKSLE